MRIPYVGTDLEAMSFAVNYHKWILDEFRPYLGRRLVEVGAGTGGFSELLATLDIDTLVLVEPSDMVEELNAKFSQFEHPKVQVLDGSFSKVRKSIRPVVPDSIIYVNVLEHIEDDLAELEMVLESLSPGGKVFIFVPAHQWLYGKFDRAIGHFRRYSRRELEAKCTGAGFKILHSRYFDLIGIIPWWIKFKVLKSASLGSGSVRFYDAYLLPVSRLFERIFFTPSGKNILLVAEKP